MSHDIHQIDTRGLQLLLETKRTFQDYSPTMCVDTKSSEYCWHYHHASQKSAYWMSQQGDTKGMCRHGGTYQTLWLELCRLISHSPYPIILFLNYFTIFTIYVKFYGDYLLTTQNTWTFCSAKSLKCMRGVHGWLSNKTLRVTSLQLGFL